MSSEPVSYSKLINEKLNNFKKFCESVFPNNELIKKQSADMCDVPNIVFVQYVKDHIQPYENNLEGYVKKVTKEYGIEMKDLTEEQKSKFEKYFRFFIAVTKEL
jgi:hypothetical protein